MGAARFAVFLAAATVAGAAKAKARPATDCIVTATYPDGREEPRDCYLLSTDDVKPGTKGRFEYAAPLGVEPSPHASPVRDKISGLLLRVRARC